MFAYNLPTSPPYNVWMLGRSDVWTFGRSLTTSPRPHLTTSERLDVLSCLLPHTRHRPPGHICQSSTPCTSRMAPRAKTAHSCEKKRKSLRQKMPKASCNRRTVCQRWRCSQLVFLRAGLAVGPAILTMLLTYYFFLFPDMVTFTHSGLPDTKIGKKFPLQSEPGHLR